MHEPPGSTNYGPGDTSGLGHFSVLLSSSNGFYIFRRVLKKNHYGNANQNHNVGDFSGGPVVKNLSSSTGDTGSPLVGELRSYML